MKASILPCDLSAEMLTKELCHVIELSNSEEDPDLSIARIRVEPGTTTRWHRLMETTERYCIMEGTGLIEVGELPAQSVTAGDVIMIPEMCRQRITNSGKEDLIFLTICTPRFLPENYQDIEGNM